MMPVLIEFDFDDFLDAISARLRMLISQEEEISEELILKLLRKRRLLVIVDHFSEMNEKTRSVLRPGSKDIPANALMVTSRIKEQLGGIPKTVIEPLRIEGDYISNFMGAYLKTRGKRSLFPDSEYFPMLGRLSTMVGDRDITVMLSRLYAEQMIAVREGAPTDLPETIPDLMLNYLNWLSRENVEGGPSKRQVQHLAKPLAWMCLQKTYRPTSARLEEVQTILPDVDEAILHYFEKKLRLIQTIGPAEDQIQFTLDPLAEYLAGLHVVAQVGGDEQKWRKFLDDADEKPNAPDAIQGFLLAVRDCCLLEDYRKQIPDFVPNELAERAGLDPEAIKKARLKQRIRQLTSNLTMPEAEDRLYATQALGEIGPAAETAIKPLADILKDKNSDVRWKAAWALGRIGPAAVGLLVKALKEEESEIRQYAAKALAQIGPRAGAAVEPLIEVLKDEDSEVRTFATEALVISLAKIGQRDGPKRNTATLPL